MATAKQLVARKLFAARSKAGTLKKVSKKSRDYAKNPSPKTSKKYRVLLRQKNGEFSTILDNASLTNAKKLADENYEKGYTVVVMNANHDVVYTPKHHAKNPRSRTQLVCNPKVKYKDIAKNLNGDRQVAYAVHLQDRPSYHAIAYFSKKIDAIEVAQEAADRTGEHLAVSRVQIHFGEP